MQLATFLKATLSGTGSKFVIFVRVITGALNAASSLTGRVVRLPHRERLTLL